MDTLKLSKTGFVLIRNLLQGRIPGGIQAAEDLAEALHNLPENGNDFLQQITIENLQKYVEKYAHLEKEIKKHISL